VLIQYTHTNSARKIPSIPLKKSSSVRKRGIARTMNLVLRSIGKILTTRRRRPQALCVPSATTSCISRKGKLRRCNCIPSIGSNGVVRGLKNCGLDKVAIKPVDHIEKRCPTGPEVHRSLTFALAMTPNTGPLNTNTNLFAQAATTQCLNRDGNRVKSGPHT
jgi:hypothetical protein